MNNPLVYIIVLNYKNYQDTIDCVHSLEKINYPHYRIVIVDNNSGNGSEEILKKEFSHHAIIQTGSNRGYATGNNAGMRLALEEGADYILILNNDTKVTPDFLEKLVAYADANPEAGILGPKVITETGELDITCARRRPELSDYFWRIGLGRWLLFHEKWIKKHHYMTEYDFGEVKKVDVISGSCMLIRSDVLREIGLLDEKTFLYMEEFILHEKIRNTTYFTAIIPSSIIIHKKHASIGKINYRATWALIQSHRHYIKEYRDFGKITGILALTSVGIYRGVGMLRMFLKSFFARP